MEIKKAISVVVETIVCVDGSVSCIVRMINGQPVKVLASPSELTAVFSELSADAPDATE